MSISFTSLNAKFWMPSSLSFWRVPLKCRLRLLKTLACFQWWLSPSHVRNNYLNVLEASTQHFYATGRVEAVHEILGSTRICEALAIPFIECRTFKNLVVISEDKYLPRSLNLRSLIPRIVCEGILDSWIGRRPTASAPVDVITNSRFALSHPDSQVSSNVWFDSPKYIS